MPSRGPPPQPLFVLFVDDRHLADLDRGQLLLDVFDVARIARHIAWQEPIDPGGDVDGNGIVDAADLGRAAQYLLPEPDADPRVEFSSDSARATIRLGDGSRLIVPRQWHGLQTDLEVDGFDERPGIVERIEAIGLGEMWDGLAQPPRERGIVGHAIVADVADVRLDRSLGFEKGTGLDAIFQQGEHGTIGRAGGRPLHHHKRWRAQVLHAQRRQHLCDRSDHCAGGGARREDRSADS